MSQRHRVSAVNPTAIWLLIALILLSIVTVVAVVYVVAPAQEFNRQAQATVAAQQSMATSASQQATGTAQARQAEIEQHYAAGLTFAQAGDWPAAADAFRRVIALQADYRDAPAQLADALGQIDAAMATATAQIIAMAAQERSNDAAAATAAAQQTADAQAQERAAAVAATTATTQALDLSYAHAQGLMNLCRWLEAESELQAIFDVAPDYGEVQSLLATASAEVLRLGPTPTRTPTITPTPRVSPTPTPTPSFTATQPPPTRIPTVTPLPTSTFTPTPQPTDTTTPTSTPSADRFGLNPGDVYVNPIDGAVYVRVPAGDFVMGNDAGESYERPSHEVTLDEFWIKQTEVTNAEYSRCVEAGACTPTDFYRLHDSRFANHPVVNINWQQANDYATWAGGRLPTEAEWEKACRGTDQRLYPWGNETPDATRLNYAGSGIGDTTEVGSYPAGASPYGALDMAGNVWEWVGDWYGESYYSQSPASNPEGPANGDYRVWRSSAWTNDQSRVGCGVRYWDSPGSRYVDFGGRVALLPPFSTSDP